MLVSGVRIGTRDEALELVGEDERERRVKAWVVEMEGEERSRGRMWEP